MMTTMDSNRWENEVLGEHAQYPGHPLILACMVMDRYPNLETALRREQGREFSNALSDNFILGAGCAVHAALATLRQAMGHGLEAAYAHANQYWLAWEQQNPKNALGAAHGREQAERIRSRFEVQLNSWGKPEDPGSPYRIQVSALAA